MQIDPNFAAAHYNLANLMSAHFRDFEGAHREYERALQIEPDSANTYYNLVVHFVRLNDVNGALRELNRALQIDPIFDPARQLLLRLTAVNSI